MQAWLCDDPVGPQALAWKQWPDPQPRPGQVRVAVHAASLNFPDLLIVRNQYQVKPALPFIPGCEFAGTVDAVGAGVRHLRAGDRIAVFAGSGGFATLACVDAALPTRLPAAFALDEAAAFTCTYATMHHALLDRAALQPGETVLVLGAAGGVGTAAIQIAKAAGARVLAGASGAAKGEFCLALGADAAIDTSAGAAALREQISTLTGGRGPDVVCDPVGGALAEPVFRSIAWRGRYLVIGFAQGAIPALPLNLALLKGASLVGVFWGDFARREPERQARVMAQLLDWRARGLVRPVIDSRLPMSELMRAYARLEQRQVRGKVVLCNA